MARSSVPGKVLAEGLIEAGAAFVDVDFDLGFIFLVSDVRGIVIVYSKLQ
jgi:hypothetical protein